MTNITSYCFNCYGDVHIPKTSRGPKRGICINCGAVFCKNCGRSFVCLRCLQQLDQSRKNSIIEKAREYHRGVGGGIALIAIGANLMYYIGMIGLTTHDSMANTFANTDYGAIFGITIGVVIGLAMLLGGVAWLECTKKHLLATLHAVFPGASAINLGVVLDRGSSMPMQNPQPAALLTRAPVLEPRLARSNSPRAGAREAPGSQVESIEGKKPSLPVYCIYCGEKLPQITDLAFCPNCGKKM